VLLAALAVTAAPTAAALCLGALTLWGVSLVRRDASVADPAWAPAFLLIAAVSMAVTPAPGPRAWIALTLVGLWAARLGSHLLRRNRSHGEDPRYVAMRAQHGARFWWVSLFTVFLLQATLAWIVSLPLQAAVASTTPLGILDGVGVAAWIAGFTCEAVADAQLARFRADPNSRGTVLDTGLWRYSRHPNYFGDALLWWGIGLLGAAAGAWAALVGPLLMNVLIVRVSGVSLLEKDIGDRRPGYREYVRRTSSFVPWFPKG